MYKTEEFSIIVLNVLENKILIKQQIFLYICKVSTISIEHYEERYTINKKMQNIKLLIEVRSGIIHTVYERIYVVCNYGISYMCSEHV